MWIMEALVLAGAAFIFIAALGILKMPDIYMRMHAATKAGTVGAALLLGGAAWFFASWTATLEVIIAIVFLLATAPVAFHLIGRAAYYHGVPMIGGREDSEDEDS
ncbi:MAG: monovalent cation/H(+) antiporter subunit G [Legionellaceae bacterium]|nr:monovalent cation/H(+) antiporter subunit G [Legionellaceae bacterium]